MDRRPSRLYFISYGRLSHALGSDSSVWSGDSVVWYDDLVHLAAGDLLDFSFDFRLLLFTGTSSVAAGIVDLGWGYVDYACDIFRHTGEPRGVWYFDVYWAMHVADDPVGKAIAVRASVVWLAPECGIVCVDT